jgi:ATP-dependent DNA helicase RecQ
MTDVVQRRRMIDEGAAPDEVKRVERQKLEALLAICETAGCRRQAILGHFGEAHGGQCGNCDTCLSPVARYDGTEIAIKALAAIFRTGQRFGAAHIVNVLTGKPTEQVVKFGHEKQKVFGAGNELDNRGWQSVLRQLSSAGLVLVDHAGHGALVLAEEARAVFRHERQVMLRVDQPKAASVRRSLQKAVELPPEQAKLFDALRAERRRLAEAQGVPPYVIFHDSTLRALAVAQPRSSGEMADLPGIGAAKLDRYGAAFLAVIAAEAR